VSLIDELLDAPGEEGMSFLLDGQTVVLEDYLDVRPERAGELAAALKDRRLEAGPWFVLADELIPSGEGLVRNLLAGLHTVRALRAEAPAVLYCPDSFGHPAALPDLARGFDKRLVLVWRGFGGSRAPKGDTFSWVAPSRERVILHHLTRSGYELGASLPVDADASRANWNRIRQEIGERPHLGLALVLNGADHHARQSDLPTAIATLKVVAKPDEIRPSSLGQFARDLVGRAENAKLAEVRGELRDSYGFTWTLQGTLASRTPQKRRYAAAERELLRDVEPWAALARFHEGISREALVRSAWRPLLLCQPHDTLCGCSIDQVARAMDARLESVSSQAVGLREDALLDLIGHDRDAARLHPEDWRSIVLIRNRAPRARSGVAIVAVSAKLADVPVGPGSKHVDWSRERKRLSEPSWPVEPTQVLDVGEAFERVEAPRAYPDNDAVARIWSAVWVDDVPPYGVSSVPIEGHERPPTWVEHKVFVQGRSMANGRLVLRWDAKGRITLEDIEQQRVIRGLLEWESRRDEGDLYTPSIRGRKFAARHGGTKVLHRGPLVGVVEQRWSFAAAGERVDVRLRLVLDAGGEFLRIGVLGDNHAANHRLRLRFNTDVARAETFADAAFGALKREPLSVPGRESRMEKPVASAPLHRYVSLFNPKRGVTVFSDGLTEYESGDDSISVTVLRAVGELSRSDIPERPGHAGWPTPTPEAQCIGSFEAEFGLLLHGPRTADTIHEIEGAADDVLYPLTGDTLRSARETPQPVHGVALEGVGLAFSAAKDSEDGQWLVLRCVNLLDEERDGAWTLGHAIDEAHVARLDETPLSRLRVQADTVPFRAPPRGVVTILVR
jgi:alpha-mannosidase